MSSVVSRIRSFFVRHHPPDPRFRERVQNKREALCYAYGLMKEASGSAELAEDVLYELIETYKGDLLRRHNPKRSTPSDFLFGLVRLKLLEDWASRSEEQMKAEEPMRRSRRAYWRPQLLELFQEDAERSRRSTERGDRRRRKIEQVYPEMFHPQDLAGPVQVNERQLMRARLAALEQLRESLSDDEMLLLDLMLRHDLNIAVVAQKMGLTQECARTRWRRLRKILKKKPALRFLR